MKTEAKHPENLDQFPQELHVYDFDGTLIDTPRPEDGKPFWEAVTGEQWPHKHWWPASETLDMDVFDIRPNEHVIAEFEQSNTSQNVTTLIMTGRPKKLRREVSAILTKYDIVPDELILSDGLETLTFKLQVIKEWIRRIPLTRIIFWDDRQPHLDAFRALEVEFGIEVIVNKV